MITLLVVAVLVGIVLSRLIAIVPFAAVGLVVFGLAAFALELSSAVLVFACLQAGFVAGLCLRAFAGRFHAVAALRQEVERSQETLQPREWRR